MSLNELENEVLTEDLGDVEGVMNNDSLLSSLEKDLKKVAKKKEDQDKKKYVERFSYYNPKAKICINTIVSLEANGAKIPTFVVWDGQKHWFTEEYRVPEGYLLHVPRSEGVYRSLYEDIIFPDTIIEDTVSTEVLDQKITAFLKAWNQHPEEYYCVARNYIKFTWLFERFYWRPYLLLYGDWGTGKSEFGSYITHLCQNGIVMTDISAPSLARLLDMTNSVVMLDEMEKLDRPDADRLNTILRNGYRYNGTYVVAEQETKKFAPSSYLVDQPKIIVRRKIPKDDALLSRIIPFRMIPRDKEIPDTMRRSDEREWHDQRSREAREIVNLLLKWRWQNINNNEANLLVSGMVVRFNDTIMSVLKVANQEDRKIIINFMRKQEKVAIDTASDDYRVQVIRFMNEWVERHSERGLFGSPGTHLYIADIIDIAKELVGSDASEMDFKRAWNPRYVKRVVMDLGFEVENFRNKNFIKAESLADLLPRLCEKYNVQTEEQEGDKEEAVDNLIAKAIDSDVDKSKL